MNSKSKIDELHDKAKRKSLLQDAQGYDKDSNYNKEEDNTVKNVQPVRTSIKDIFKSEIYRHLEQAKSQLHSVESISELNDVLLYVDAISILRDKDVEKLINFDSLSDEQHQYLKSLIDKQEKTINFIQEKRELVKDEWSNEVESYGEEIKRRAIEEYVNENPDDTEQRLNEFDKVTQTELSKIESEINLSLEKSLLTMFENDIITGSNSKESSILLKLILANKFVERSKLKNDTQIDNILGEIDEDLDENLSKDLDDDLDTNNDFDGDLDKDLDTNNDFDEDLDTNNDFSDDSNNDLDVDKIEGDDSDDTINSDVDESNTYSEDDSTNNAELSVGVLAADDLIDNEDFDNDAFYDDLNDVNEDAPEDEDLDEDLDDILEDELDSNDDDNSSNTDDNKDDSKIVKPKKKGSILKKILIFVVSLLAIALIYVVADAFILPHFNKPQETVSETHNPSMLKSGNESVSESSNESINELSSETANKDDVETSSESNEIEDLYGFKPGDVLTVSVSGVQKEITLIKITKQGAVAKDKDNNMFSITADQLKQHRKKLDNLNK